MMTTMIMVDGLICNKFDSNSLLFKNRSPFYHLTYTKEKWKSSNMINTEIKNLFLLELIVLDSMIFY